MEPTPWYNTQWFSAIIGAIVTLTGSYFTYKINYKIKRDNDRKSLLIVLIQSNSELFSVIYAGSLNQNNIEYIKLRHELQKTAITLILPCDLKKLFDELHSVYFNGSENYEKSKHKIANILKQIVSKLNEYGVEAFEYK